MTPPDFKSRARELVAKLFDHVGYRIYQYVPEERIETEIASALQAADEEGFKRGREEGFKDGKQWRHAIVEEIESRSATVPLEKYFKAGVRWREGLK
jgi:hypothetical protein